MRHAEAETVVGVVQSTGLHHRLRRVLSEDGLRLVRRPADRLGALPEGVGPVLVEVDAQPGRLAGLSIRRPDLGPWIGVVGDPPPPRLRQQMAYRLSEEAETFREAIRWAWVDWAEHRLVASMDRARLAVPVRAGVSAILRQRPERRELEGDAPINRTLQWLAESAGCSPDHLSRTSRAHGVDLLALHDCWRLLLGVVLRRDVQTWERVAWRLGYESSSGLNALCHRVTELGLRNLEMSPMVGLGARLRECERVLAVDDPGG